MVATLQEPRILERLANAGRPTRQTRAKRAGIDARVEMLGKLNDRHVQALGAGDRAVLIEIAGEYALIGCVNTAIQISMEAEGL